MIKLKKNIVSVFTSCYFLLYLLKSIEVTLGHVIGDKHSKAIWKIFVAFSISLSLYLSRSSLRAGGHSALEKKESHQTTYFLS